MLNEISAAKILTFTVPEELFSAPSNVAAEYKKFAMIFHPDHGGTTDAFQKLNELHVAAKMKIKIGEWNIPGVLEFRPIDGNKTIIRYFKDFDIGIGKGYIGNQYVTYVFPLDIADLVDNAVANLKKCVSPPNAETKKSIEPYLPKVKTVFRTIDKIVLVMHKSENFIRLRDVFDYVKAGNFNPKHVAWIMSRCYNFACYLEWLGYAHHDFSMDSIFIDPEKHTMMLIGGWWYSSKIGERMKRLQVSKRTIKYAPMNVLADKKTRTATDLELIRLLGRELLNDPSGMNLHKNPNVPVYLSNWLKMVTSGDAKKDYTDWDATLVKSFGVKKFTPFELKASQVYQK